MTLRWQKQSGSCSPLGQCDCPPPSTPPSYAGQILVTSCGRVDSSSSSGDDCGLLDMGCFPTGYGKSAGDTDSNWGGTSVVSTSPYWSGIGPAQWLSTENPATNHPAGAFASSLTFNVPAERLGTFRLTLIYAVDNWMTAVKINGTTVGSCGGVNCNGDCMITPHEAELTDYLVAGGNTLELEMYNCDLGGGSGMNLGFAAYFVCRGAEESSQ